MDRNDVSPETWFHERATHYVEAQVLFHLNTVGVFAALKAHGPMSGAALAAKLSLRPDILQVLLDYVVGVDPILRQTNAGDYEITAFGEAVVARFGRHDGEAFKLNLFDVRVGAYGPVWEALGELVRGEQVYGRDVKRRGDVAADAVYKVSARLLPALRGTVDRLPISQVIECGVTTGLVAALGKSHPHLQLTGMDRSEQALKEASEYAGDNDVAWVAADLFDPASWAPANAADAPGLIFSVHFHEFLAAGEEAIESWLQELATHFPGWWVYAIEQPALEPSDEARATRAEWLYNHSNILIHHLIGNGKILDDMAWWQLFSRGNCPIQAAENIGFLGYRGYLGRLQGRS